MFRKLAFGAMVCVSTVAMAAPDAKDDLTAAAKKLSDASNYSWKQTTDGQGGFGGGGQEGKTEKDGYTSLNMTFGDNTIQVVMKGKKAAVKLEDGWKSTEELAANNDGGQPGPGMFIGRMVQSYKAPGSQAEEYISKLNDIKKEDDAYTAELSGAEAAALMPRMGRRGGGGGGNAAPPPMQNAKLSLKMWVKDGVLTKYSTHITGTITFNGEDRDIDRTTTIEISDVGSTKVDVPDDAKKKLE